MRRIPVVIAGALLATTLLGPSPAFAASTSHPRVSTLAASSEYIVYQQKTTSTELRPVGAQSGAKVFATDLTGQRMPLPGFGGSRPIFLVGSVVVQAGGYSAGTLSTPGSQTVRWFDLDTRRGGTVVDQPGEALVGGAPDGWVVQKATGTTGVDGVVERLTYVHRDGSRTDLGVPYPDGQGIDVTTSDTGIVVSPLVSDETSFVSTVLFQPWASIGPSWRTVFTARDPQVAVQCAPSSTTTVACLRAPLSADPSKSAFSYGLIALDGSGARWLIDSHRKACQHVAVATAGSDLVAVENTNHFGCTTGKLFRFTWDRRLVDGGSRRYSSTGIATGLGGASGETARILLSSADQRSIDTLRSITATPHALVRG